MGTRFLHAGQWPFDHTIPDRLIVLPNMSPHNSSSDMRFQGSARLTMRSRIAAAQACFVALARALAKSSAG